MDSGFSENEILITITIGIIAMLLLALVFVLFFYFSQKKFQAQKLAAQEQALEHQEKLLYSNIQAQEVERRRIARELHDEIGSKLNVINLGLHRLQKATSITSSKDDTLHELFDVVGTTINSTRHISHQLLPPTLENFGLASALDELCENFSKASDVNIEYKYDQNGQPEPDHKTALSIFRIAQELISNSFNHANANLIEIKLYLKGSEIQFTYRDDGIGFDINDATHKKGLGTQNIESRAQMIGAEYYWKCAKGKGIFFQLKKQLS